MGAGRISIGDLVAIVYGLLPLLLYFNLSELLLVVVECADVTMFADFMCPALMVFRRPDLKINLVLIVTMGFKLQIDLLRIGNDRIVTVRNFLDHIIPVDPLVAVNFAVLLASEIRTADAKAREFNLVPRFALYGFMIRIVSILNLEGGTIHLVHTESKLLVGITRRQIGAILILERLGNVDTLFNESLIMTFLEVVVPFSGGVEIFLCHNPAGASTVILVNGRIGRKENTGGCINRNAAGIRRVEYDMVQDIFFYFSVMRRISVLFNGPALQAADDRSAAFVLDGNLELLDIIVPAVGHVKDNGLSLIFDDFPAVLRHDVLHVRAVDINGCILSRAER